jgi:hypothetical protein
MSPRPLGAAAVDMYMMGGRRKEGVRNVRRARRRWEGSGLGGSLPWVQL